jgi:hypothetical protein
MSYQWIGEKFTNKDRFPKAFYDDYPNLPHIAAYQDPLYAFVTLNTDGMLSIEGVRSQWMPPSPYDLGMPEGLYGSKATPEISDYKLHF